MELCVLEAVCGGGGSWCEVRAQKVGVVQRLACVRKRALGAACEKSQMNARCIEEVDRKKKRVFVVDELVVFGLA